jgi:hypothetical protein
MAILRRQQGFSGLEMILGVVVAALLVGGGVYIWDHRHNSATSTKQTATSSQSSSPVATKSDDDLMKEAITKYCGSLDATQTGSFNSSTKEHEGAFYKASASCIDSNNENSSGFTAIMKKSNGSMEVVFAGQEPPTKAEGEKAGLPAGWYTAD